MADASSQVQKAPALPDALPELALERVFEQLEAQDKISLCAAVKPLLPWLAGGRLWRQVRFQAAASERRSLAAHLAQFATWAQGRAAHLRSLTLAYDHTNNPGFQARTDRDWFCRKLGADELAALHSVLSAVAGAPLTELCIAVYAKAIDGELPGEVLQLPQLQSLSLGVPMLTLCGSLTHLTALHSLAVHGSHLDPEVQLPASLAALESSSVAIDEWNSEDGIVLLPFDCPTRLRSLSIRGGCDENGQQQLFLDGLGALVQLTSLELLGPELALQWGEEEEEEEEEEGEEAPDEWALLTPAMRQMARLRALEKLSLSSVAGISHEGRQLALPCWPALTSFAIWDCYGVTDLAVSALPALQELSVRNCDELAKLSISDLPALQKLVVLLYGFCQDPSALQELMLARLPSVQHMEVSPHVLGLLPAGALPGLTHLGLVGHASTLLPSHVATLAQLPHLQRLHICYYTSSADEREKAAEERLRTQLPGLTIEQAPMTR